MLHLFHGVGTECLAAESVVEGSIVVHLVTLWFCASTLADVVLRSPRNGDEQQQENDGYGCQDASDDKR